MPVFAVLKELPDMDSMLMFVTIIDDNVINYTLEPCKSCKCFGHTAIIMF